MGRQHVHKSRIRKFTLASRMVVGNICCNLQGFFILQDFQEEVRFESNIAYGRTRNDG